MVDRTAESSMTWVSLFALAVLHREDEDCRASSIPQGVPESRPLKIRDSVPFVVPRLAVPGAPNEISEVSMAQGCADSLKRLLVRYDNDLHDAKKVKTRSRKPSRVLCTKL